MVRRAALRGGVGRFIFVPTLVGPVTASVQVVVVNDFPSLHVHVVR